MTGPREHHGSKPGREIFLTSSSLSFSSLTSSSCSSSDDGIEINLEASQTSYGDDQKGKHVKDSSRGSETSCVTHVTMQPAPSPPSKLRPGSPYDPERIPASVFGKNNKDLNWSDESLFSLRMSNYEGFHIPDDVLMMMPGEFLAYSPSLKIKSEDGEGEITQMEKKKSNDIHGEKSSSSASSPAPPAYSYPTSFAQLYQHVPPATTKAQSFSLPDGEKESKKTKKTRKNKKMEKKKKKKKKNKCCCIWPWLSSRLSKCKCYLSCFCCCCK